MFNRRNRKKVSEEKFGDIAVEEEMNEMDDHSYEVEEYTTVENEEVKEEPKREKNRYKLYKTIINVVFGIIVVLLMLTVVDVISVGKYNNGPFFAIPVKTYKDGGTKEYYGFGYKVIKYNQLQGRRDKALGFWNLKYDTNPMTLQDVDLAIDLTENEENFTKNYYKKFVRILSNLYKVDDDSDQILLGYHDEDGKYSLDIVCFMSKDQTDLSDFEVDKDIAIIGTITDYKGATDKKNRRVYVSDCFAQQ